MKMKLLRAVLLVIPATSAIGSIMVLLLLTLRRCLNLWGISSQSDRLKKRELFKVLTFFPFQVQTFMTKSLCFLTLQVIELYHPLALRLFLMGTHYRSPINYSDFLLESASERVFYIYQVIPLAKVTSFFKSRMLNDDMFVLQYNPFEDAHLFLLTDVTRLRKRFRRERFNV